MSGRAFRWVIAGVGGILFLAAILIPTGALIARAIASGSVPTSGWWLSARQWGLLRYTVALAGGATGMSIVLALPAAYVIGQWGRLSDRPVLVALMSAPLLLPPMVYAFGWQRLITLPMPLQCVWVWSAWSWPIPAFIVGSGWSRFGRSGYDAALLCTSAAPAFLRVVLPVLVRYIGVAGLVLFVLFVGEYSVPHSCGLSVYSTELLGLAENSGPRTLEVLWPSLPLVVVASLGVGAALVVWRRSTGVDEAELEASAPPVVSRALVGLAMGLVGVSVVVPLAKLAFHSSTPAWLVSAWRTYHTELLQSLAVSIGAGGLAVVMGIGLCLMPVARGIAAGWALGFGILPGALAGEGLAAAYLNVPAVYDSWVIVVLAYVARFGWVGMLLGWLALRSTRRDLIWQARADGASEMVVDARIRLWPNWPTLGCGVCLVAAFSLADVTAVSLVRVPTIGAISLTLIEKMHRFEEGMLVSLSLWLVASALPAAVLLGVALRRRV